jgi:hypothetical protein
MKSLKLRETRKLHYGKYLYKLVLPSVLAYAFRTSNQRTKNLSYAKSVLDEINSLYERNQPLVRQMYRTKQTISEFDFLDAMDIYSLLKQNTNDYRIRCERNTLSIATNDLNLANDIAKKFRSSGAEFWKPQPEMLAFLSLKHDVVLVDKTPDMEFKIYLNNNRCDPSFAAWLEKNDDKSKVGHYTLGNIKHSMYNGNAYFYVRDEKVLLMVQMYISKNIRRIEKLVYKGDIDKY